jgi:hypothetical protein
VKRLKYVFLFILLIPVFVKAEDITMFTQIIDVGNEVKLYNYGDRYHGVAGYDVNSITFDPSNISNEYYFDGIVNITLNQDTTIYNLKAYYTSEKTDYIVVPIEIVRLKNGDESIVLEDLDVVGYKLDYKSNVTDYKVIVPSDIKEVYINAVGVGNLTQISGDGVIKLDNKKTVHVLEVYNESLGTNKYTITIVKKNKIIPVVIIMLCVFALIIGIMIFYFKKYQDKISNVNPDILKSKAKEIDVEDIIKQSEEKKKESIDNVSSEVLRPGVLTPRTMIPEEQEK